MRRTIVVAGRASLLAIGIVAPPLSAADPAAGYPIKPVRVVIAQEAGSSVDTNIRVLAPLLGEALGGSLVVDNRPGAGGAIGMAIGAAAAPDGYTLVGVGSPQMIAPFAFRKLEYDLFRDFVPIARYTVSHNVFVVTPGLRVGSVKEFIELAKAKPGQINMSTAGPDSASHLAGSLFSMLAAINTVPIHYKGGGAAVIAIIANESQYMITPMPAVLGQIRAGRLKAIGVGGDQRAPQLPQVPTIEEAGVAGYRSVGWSGLLMPRGTPAAITEKVTATVTTVLTTDSVREKILDAGGEPGLLAGASFKKFMQDDMARFGTAAKAADLKIE
ncbi:MAG: tripartite tricarboxylate transporter substrate-binding protein [Betaproteobacteria bacterium]